MDTTSNTQNSDFLAPLELELVPLDSSVELSKYEKIPFAQLSSLGMGVSEIPNFLKKKETLYRAVDDAGKSIRLTTQSTNGQGLRAMIFKNGDLIGNASFQPVTISAVNPATLCASAAISAVTSQLNQIAAMQEQLLDFLETDKQSKIRGTVLYLHDALRNYTCSSQNELYKTGVFVKLQDAKNEAYQNIEFYQKQIDKVFTDKERIVTKGDIDKAANSLRKPLQIYRLCVSIYALASYAEVIFTENYSSSGYLSSVSKQISDVSAKYDAYYQKSCAHLDALSARALEHHAIKTVAKAGTAASLVFEKTPLLRKTPIHEHLSNGSYALRSTDKAHFSKAAKSLASCQDTKSQIFAEKIDHINAIYNEPVDILMSGDALYLKALPSGDD